MSNGAKKYFVVTSRKENKICLKEIRDDGSEGVILEWPECEKYWGVIRARAKELCDRLNGYEKLLEVK